MEKGELIEELKRKLTTEGKSVPELCRATKITDEYMMLSAIAELEDSGDIILNGFDRVYREDGGAIYLAKYSKKAS